MCLVPMCWMCHLINILKSVCFQGHQERYIPAPKEEEAEQYTYIPFELENCGPHLPSLDDIIACG